MNKLKLLILSLFITITSISYSQSGWRSNYYYANQGGYENVYIGSYQKWVCCDYWGNGRYITAYRYKETKWHRSYGSRQVKMWNYNTGQWYYAYQSGYSWSYNWRYYDKY